MCWPELIRARQSANASFIAVGCVLLERLTRAYN